jgi:hypothetical protein
MHRPNYSVFKMISGFIKKIITKVIVFKTTSTIFSKIPKTLFAWEKNNTNNQQQ